MDMYNISNRFNNNRCDCLFCTFGHFVGCDMLFIPEQSYRHYFECEILKNKICKNSHSKSGFTKGAAAL